MKLTVNIRSSEVDYGVNSCHNYPITRRTHKRRNSYTPIKKARRINELRLLLISDFSTPKGMPCVIVIELDASRMDNADFWGAESVTQAQVLYI